MKNVYGYIRVSTVKQGTGVSLEEQQEAIIRYAEKHQLNIIQWFEEKQTAAKQGRPLFSKMMKLLRAKKAHGVIVHKIDRGTRNFKDWVALQELMASGSELHFAHESLDMNTRAGRLTADLLVALATDYIRNLREEAIKGIYGRLKQGIYPFQAPPGYDNNGKGKLKTVDPIQRPLVLKAFELYATGKYNHETLAEVMYKLGLRNTAGHRIQTNRISTLLNNSFYTGVMNVKGKIFQGKHEPIVSPKLFMEVQNILKGKVNTRSIKHDFVFRRRVKCVDCSYSLIPEKQKGHVYYRCQTKECPTKTIREEPIDEILKATLEKINLNPVEDKVLNQLLEEAQLNWSETQQGLEQSLKLQQSNLSKKLNRLTDAYIENVIDKSQFEEKKEQLMIEQQGLRSNEGELSSQKEAIFKKAVIFLELLKNLKKSYRIGLPYEKRKVMKKITSNLTVKGKEVMITMLSPFQEIANRSDFLQCALERGIPRTKIANVAISAFDNPNISINSTLGHDSDANFLIALENSPQFRASMKSLLDLILTYCESEKESLNEVDEEYDL